MEKLVGAVEAWNDWNDMLQAVAGRGDRYVIELGGERVAAVVPLDLYERWKQERAAFFDQLETMAQRADLSPEDAVTLAEDAVRAVRRAGVGSS